MIRVAIALGLVEAVVEGEHAHRLPVGVVGDERLLLALLVVVDERARRRAGSTSCCGSSAASVMTRASGKSRSKSRMLLDVRAAPLVDRLVGVADDAQVRVIDATAAGDLVLGEVGVLVLVDEDVRKRASSSARSSSLCLQGQRRQVEQVVEVQRVARRAAASRRPGRPSADGLREEVGRRASRTAAASAAGSWPC